ncbi:protein EARLY FLOWERING 3 isoform X2 [Humulus lupulus]|uniref:protein EARLY FLOWERING 3 isoform X2 n=1 Tax=Humulus lupulus TaxID=3486 RepID=UPI002B417EA5|nr:protein EARLY FLOWERING 3 isoform X2 [Humulus lupulus]
MRGLKDMEKITSPMFPRLHVNDAEKGGPRAPPRNKMALYEQLSIPSQRSTSGSAPKLPRQQNNSSSLVSSISSDQATAYPSSFNPFYDSTAPSYLAEKLHSTSGGIKLLTTGSDHEQKSMHPTNYQRSDSDATGPLSTAKSASSQTCNYSEVKSFSFKMPSNDNNVRVSISSQNKIPRSSCSQQSKESKKMPQLSVSSTLRHKSSCENVKSGHSVRVHSDVNTRPARISQDPVEGFASIPVVGQKDFGDASSCPVTAVNNSERSKRGHAALNQENNSSRDVSRKLHDPRTQTRKEFVTLCDKVIVRDNLVEPVKSPVGESSSKFHEQENCDTPTGRRDDVQEVPMVDATSTLNVRPDDVVGVLGEKQFWKARRTIAHHQKIFAVQVFELHRLIRVQRSIARSPHALHDDRVYLHKPTKQASQVKKTQSDYIVKPSAPVVKPKNCHQKPNPNTEHAQEGAVRKLPLPSVHNNSSKGLVSKQSSYDEYLRNPPPAPTTMNNSAAWPFHSTSGNQWLVPVMTPSEGLVYKPYPGPCPPTPGFAVPNYGSCGPMSLNGGSTYGGPACNQQAVGIHPGAPPIGNQTYYPPPYGLPVMNTFVSSGVEQMAPFGIGRSNEPEYQCSFEEVNFTKPHQSSCNISSQMSRAMSCYGEAFQASKGSELQRSTASSSSESGRGDALPLFPMAPTVDEPDQNTEESSKHQTRVIKVVPHNARSATESAARIFRSIQEERKHLHLISS